MEFKQVIVIRRDLHTNVEKIIRCASRSSLRAAELTKQKKPKIYHLWSSQGQKKIAVKITNRDTMNKLINYCKNKGLCWSFDDIENKDNNEYLVISIGPVKSPDIDPITKEMKLL